MSQPVVLLNGPADGWHGLLATTPETLMWRDGDDVATYRDSGDQTENGLRVYLYDAQPADSVY